MKRLFADLASGARRARSSFRRIAHTSGSQWMAESDPCWKASPVVPFGDKDKRVPPNCRQAQPLRGLDLRGVVFPTLRPKAGLQPSRWIPYCGQVCVYVRSDASTSLSSHGAVVMSPESLSSHCKADSERPLGMLPTINLDLGQMCAPSYDFGQGRHTFIGYSFAYHWLRARSGRKRQDEPRSCDRYRVLAGVTASFSQQGLVLVRADKRHGDSDGVRCPSKAQANVDEHDTGVFESEATTLQE